MKIFFDIVDGLIQIDGKIINSTIEDIDCGIHSLLYISKQNYVISILEIANGKIIPNINYAVAKIEDDLYYLSFINQNISPQPLAYYQEEIKSTKSHFLTIYKSLYNHYLTIETQEEIFNKILPGELKDIKVSTSDTSSGILITLIGCISNMKYIEIILYNDDYNSIFYCLCDDINFVNNEFIISDNMNDSVGRKMTRHLSFKDGSYIETKREFSYKYRPNILPETLPFIFLESMFSKDYEFASMLLKDKSSISSYKSLLGNFSKIINLEDKTKYENRIYLLYNEKSQNYIKSFDFIVSNNLIEQIYLIEP